MVAPSFLANQYQHHITLVVKQPPDANAPLTRMICTNNPCRPEPNVPQNILPTMLPPLFSFNPHPVHITLTQDNGVMLV